MTTETQPQTQQEQPDDANVWRILGRLEANQEAMLQRMDRQEQAMLQRMNQQDARMDRLEAKIDGNQRWTIGLLLLILIAVVGSNWLG